MAQQITPNRLRAWRTSRGLTLGDEADLTGLDVGFLSRLERGEREASPMTKVRIARGLGVRINEIFEPELAGVAK